jgi:hypothetical protein
VLAGWEFDGAKAGEGKRRGQESGVREDMQVQGLIMNKNA